MSYSNFEICRRREWDLSEEAESTAELVKSLQKENSELCDKERKRVEDSREKEGGLAETLGNFWHSSGAGCHGSQCDCSDSI